jgi:transcriptional regulator with XRE-family HTH domain
MLSHELRVAIKLSPNRQYELAQVAGVHPTTLSSWVNNIVPVRDGDPRVLKLAAILGVPANRAFAADQPATLEVRSARR